MIEIAISEVGLAPPEEVRPRDSGGLPGRIRPKASSPSIKIPATGARPVRSQAILAWHRQGWKPSLRTPLAGITIKAYELYSDES